MNLFSQPDAAPAHIEITEPALEDCTPGALPPEGNVKFRNYRLIHDNIRMYSSDDSDKTKFHVCAAISPPRARILELLRPEDPGRETLEAIVRPISRRGLVKPFDDDTKRFIQRALSSPFVSIQDQGTIKDSSETKSERSLADELLEAEQDEQSGSIRRELLEEFRRGGAKEALERERLGKLALAVEEDEGEGDGEGEGLTAAGRRLDALLAESRALHAELAGIHADMQAECIRASRCAAAARALRAESRALRFLDDVVALLRGDVAAAARARGWPFALPARLPGRNYVV